MTSGSVHFIIVNRGKANSLLHRAQEIGAKRGTVMLGEGTMASPILDFFGINQSQKEVLLIAVPDEVTESFYGMLRTEFNFHHRYKGIAFSVPYRAINKDTKKREEVTKDYHAAHICLMTVLERGLAEECMRVARAAGARGGTILHGRGSTGKEAQTIFGIEIEPEKEIVLILTPVDITQRVFDAIAQKMDIDAPGNGIMYVEPIATTRGLFESTQQ